MDSYDTTRLGLLGCNEKRELAIVVPGFESSLAILWTDTSPEVQLKFVSANKCNLFLPLTLVLLASFLILKILSKFDPGDLPELILA